jgi:hypothetical protein
MSVRKNAGKIKFPIENKRAEISLENISHDGYFSGYASLFGIVDLANDIVEFGAFSKTLERHSSRPVRMLFQHDPDQVIGRWVTIYEDRKGLYVEGQLSLDVVRAKDIHALMLSGALDGLSIGFKTCKSCKDPKTDARHILEADLWEISVVTFPMLPDARVTQVKSEAPLSDAFDTKIAAKIKHAAIRLSSS